VTRLAILISGRGSNMERLVAACRTGDIAAEPVAVIANRLDATGLQTANRYGVPASVVDHRAFADRPAFEKALDGVLADARADIVACAGFMRVLTAGFVARWEGRLINIHPALLPAFKGLDTHARALAAGVRLHGCSVHFVSAGVDEGAIIGQAALRVAPGDTVQSLAERVLVLEHLLYPRCIDALARGQVRYDNGRARVDAAVAANLAILAG
jgi:phosphoribosylglycinamide formyltransferase-1